MLEEKGLVFEKEGKVVTDSLKIAEMFEKEHKNVLRDIANFIDELPEHFIESSYINSRGRTYPRYFISKEGVLLLVASMRGKEVAKPKIKLLTAFNMVPPIRVDRSEKIFGDKLEEALQANGIALKKQYAVKSYRVDFFISELNLAIEYDEDYHEAPSHQEKDELRMMDIKNEIGCEFLRLKAKDGDSYNIGLVFKKIMEVLV